MGAGELSERALVVVTAVVSTFGAGAVDVGASVVGVVELVVSAAGGDHESLGVAVGSLRGDQHRGEHSVLGDGGG